MIGKYNTQLHILDKTDRMKLATFLWEELGIRNIMYIKGDGTDIKILSYVEAVKDDEA